MNGLAKQSVTNIELLDLEAHMQFMVAQKIFEILQGEHDLSPEQVEFWKQRAVDHNEVSKINVRIFHEFKKDFERRRAASIVPYQNADLN